MGSDESHFNVSLIVRDKVTTQCPQTTAFLKKTESRSEIEPPPFRYALTLGQTGSLKLQALVYDILPSNTAVFSYAIGSRKLSANEQFFLLVLTVVSLLQTTQIKQGVSFVATNIKFAQAQIKPLSFESRRNFFFFYPAGCVSCLRACFGARLLLQSY